MTGCINVNSCDRSALSFTIRFRWHVFDAFSYYQFVFLVSFYNLDSSQTTEEVNMILTVGTVA
jgi:hypothetical protein